MKRHLRTVSAAAALILATACGGDDTANDAPEDTMPNTSTTTSEDAASKEHNESDVDFAQQMIPHHQQAVEMSDMVPARTHDSAIEDLAEQIKKAQDPEIEQMNGFLERWGEPTEPDTSDDEHMPGMMTEQDMRKLDENTGEEFDTMWLEMMIDHHQGAVEMAQTELDEGVNDEAKEPARDIIDSQESEIQEMENLLQE